jgi:hypothetical protein
MKKRAIGFRQFRILLTVENINGMNLELAGL